MPIDGPRRDRGGSGEGLDNYLTKIASESIPGDGEVRELIRLVRDKTASRSERIGARNRLVSGNLRLVVSVARHYCHMGLSIDDLISEGNMGLMRAVRGYRLNRGTKFASYAPYWIRAAIRHAISRQVRQVRVPDYMHWLLRRVERSKNEMTGRLGRQPELDEVRSELNIPKSRAQFLSDGIATAEACRPSARGLEEAGSRDVGPEEAATRKDGVEWLANLMRRLPKRHARILRRRLGDGMSLSKIGREFGLTRERVRQISAEAIAMVRAAAHGGSMVAAARAVRAERKRTKRAKAGSRLAWLTATGAVPLLADRTPRTQPARTA